MKTKKKRYSTAARNTTPACRHCPALHRRRALLPSLPARIRLWGMEPSAEVLLKKIRELEASHARLKQDMSRLMPADGGARRADCGSHSVSPRRTNSGGGVEGSAAAWARGSSSSRLQRESRGPTDSPGGSPAGIRLSEGQCLNILQSLAQSVHIFDLEGRIIYWSVALAFPVVLTPFFFCDQVP